METGHGTTHERVELLGFATPPRSVEADLLQVASWLLVAASLFVAAAIAVMVLLLAGKS